MSLPSVIDIGNCARCGRDHVAVKLSKLDGHDRYNAWAMCPVVEQPILVISTEDFAASPEFDTCETKDAEVASRSYHHAANCACGDPGCPCNLRPLKLEYTKEAHDDICGVFGGITPHYSRVCHFMQKAGQETPGTVTVPDEETRKLRAALLFEECMETIRALGCSIHPSGTTVILDGSDDFEALIDGSPNLVEIADGCADISVVTTGTLIACGIKDKALLEAIDASSLAKFDRCCPRCGGENSREVAHDEVCDSSRPEFCCDDCCLRFYPGYRREDGKWVKPVHWKVPDIQKLINEQ
jgi:predicted HAD superfamily Cof-like phosphohydrolase